jgi:predicted TIM-barrel fold metal-dependent hydrolase
MDLFRNTKVYDWHEHIFVKESTRELDTEKCDRLAEHAKLLFIDKIAVSRPTSSQETPESIAIHNNIVAEGVKRHPGLFYGMCFVDPHHGGQATAEIERCVKELGFVGIKLYTQRTIDDPLQYPIIEKCIELDIPILMHSMKFGMRYPGPEPFSSHSAHFANIARRYPEAVFIVGHIVNGDWHWQLKGLADCPNVFADISGSSYDQGVVDAFVRAFGADRMLFASDGSFSASVGKLLGADLRYEDKTTILNAPRFSKYIDRNDK